MFNYEKILLNELNYMKSCIMPDGAVLHRPVKQGITFENPDVIPVFPYDAGFVGMSLVANYGDTATAGQIIQWYLRNLIKNVDSLEYVFAENTMPCFLYTVYPDRSYKTEVIDYRFAEVLAHKNDPTSSYYEMANDPVRNMLYEEYLHQAKTSAMFLVFSEVYIKLANNFAWGYAHLEDLTMIANSILNNMFQYQSGSDPISVTTTLSSVISSDNTSYLVDNISVYNGLLGTYELLAMVQNPSAVLFQNAASAVQNSLNLFIVKNQYTEPVGTIFAESISNIQHGGQLQLNTPSVNDLADSWQKISTQLQIYYYLSASQSQNILVDLKMFFDANKLYAFMGQKYPDWMTKLPSTYDNTQSWMVAGAIALQMNDISSAVQQIVAAQEVRDEYWNVQESGWTVLNLLQLIRMFDENPALEDSTVWNNVLAQNIPASMQPLYGVNDTSYITPKNTKNKMAFFLGDPLKINGTSSTYADFVNLVQGSDLLVVSYYGDTTKRILTLPEIKPMRTFCYISVGSGARGTPTDDAAIMSLVDTYASIGFSGVFFDNFGSQNGVTRDRQNNLIDYVHGKNMQVFASADHASEICDSGYDPEYNVSAQGTHMTTGDIFLIDSFATDHGDIDHDMDDISHTDTLLYAISRSQEAIFYKQRYGFDIAALAYASVEDTANHWQFNSDNIFEVSEFDPNTVGINTSLEQYVGDYDMMLAATSRITEMGPKWIRNYCYWSQVESGLLGNRDFTDYDEVINNAVQNNLNVLFVLAYDNALAPITNNWEVFLKAYIDFVTAAVSHFKGQVRAWEVWSGENLQEYWQTTPSPQQYLELLSGTYTVIKNIDPNAIVVLGSIYGLNDMENDGDNTLGPLIDTSYLAELYQLGAARYFDVIGLNVQIPVQLQVDTDDTGPDPDDFNQNSTPMPFILHPTINPFWLQAWGAFVGMLENLGDGNRKVWITSTGLPTYYNDENFLPDDIQYLYLVDFLKFVQNHSNIERLFIKELVDRSSDVTNANDNFGLMYYGLQQPKEAYLMLKTMLRGTVLPYNMDAIMPTWQSEIQYAYILFLMLGLDYFYYATYYNLSYAVRVDPPYIPLVNNSDIESPIFLSDFPNNTINGLYIRNLHSGILEAGVVNDQFISAFVPHPKPLTTHATCPNCIAILEGLESKHFESVRDNTMFNPYDVVAPFTINGWEEIKIAEGLGWNTLDNNFGLGSSSAMTPMLTTAPASSNTMPMQSLRKPLKDAGTITVEQVIAVLEAHNINLVDVMNVLQTNNIDPSTINSTNLSDILALMQKNGIIIDPSWFSLTTGTNPLPTTTVLVPSGTQDTTTIGLGMSQSMMQQMQIQAVNELLTLSSADLSNGRWCKLCGFRVF